MRIRNYHNENAVSAKKYMSVNVCCSNSLAQLILNFQNVRKNWQAHAKKKYLENLEDKLKAAKEKKDVKFKALYKKIQVCSSKMHSHFCVCCQGARALCTWDGLS